MSDSPLHEQEYSSISDGNFAVSSNMVTTEPDNTEHTSSGKPKRNGSMVMIIGLLLLLIALPIGVYYISQGQSLNDIRNRAFAPYPIVTPLPGGSCPGGYTPYYDTALGVRCKLADLKTDPLNCGIPGHRCAVGQSCSSGTCSQINIYNGAQCGGFNATQQANIDKIKQQNPNANNQILGCIGNDCTWRDACAPVVAVGTSNGTACDGLTQISTGESYNGAFVGCSSTGLNCFCSGGGHVGDKNLSGTVRCYADYAGDSCGNQTGPKSTNTPGTTGTTTTITTTIKTTTTVVSTSTNTPTHTVTHTPTFTPTNTPSITHTPTFTPTNTPSITSTPTVTPLVTNTPTNTPSITSTPTVTPLVTNTPTNTPLITNTPSPTPTPAVGCNETCTVNTDCSAGLVCSDSRCRLNQCLESSTCQCAVSTNTPSQTPTPTPAIAFVGCNSGCTVNTDCSTGLVCIDSSCRNPSCTEKVSCQCDMALVATPQTPIAGTGPSILGAMVIAGGLFCILLGLAL